ncbi:hypothetical protein [Streptomyces sp. SPB4]|uniref:hypothetical protein n=1 Tax=Streptomyces sp. SPB4 TaxID=2940553 RepID=UPI002474282E|nr:hypothetical protein [Streptomyces sp. SPB4]MDH6545220.1 hypothetical protein [Streptomyces sp. SPB4]
MSEESVITIEILGHEKASLDAAHPVSHLFLSSGPSQLRRTPGEGKVTVLVYADFDRGPGERGYLDPETAQLVAADRPSS